MKGLARSAVSRCMDRCFMFEDVSKIYTAIFKLSGEYATLAATSRTLKTKAFLQYCMDYGFNYLDKVHRDNDWTVNKSNRAQI